MNIRSYRSEKTKVLKSSIHGRGLFSIKSIKKNEIVAIKGGHILNKKTYLAKKKIIGEAECQIADGFYIAPSTKKEYEQVMIYLNHSCEPNVGLMGSTIFIAIQDIPKNTELTIDYAFYKDDKSFKLSCICGTTSCRQIITGKDWKRKDIQKKYKKYFSTYLQDKIN